jgi:hypothetical protein
MQTEEERMSTGEATSPHTIAAVPLTADEFHDGQDGWEEVADFALDWALAHTILTFDHAA